MARSIKKGPLPDFQIRGETENWFFNGSSIKSVYQPKFETIEDDEIAEAAVLLNKTSED